MKISQFLKEERNAKSDFSEIKSLVKTDMKKISNIKVDLYEKIGKKIISMAKSLEEGEIEDFKYTLSQWIEKNYPSDPSSMSSDVETLIDSIIEKYYS